MLSYTIGRTSVRRRIAGLLVGTVIALSLLVPVFLLAGLARSTVESDIVADGARHRLEAAEMAATLTGGVLEATGARLELIGGRANLRAALRAKDVPALARHLSDLKGESDRYLGFIALDQAGRIITADPPPLPEAVGQSFAARDYYVGATASSGWFVSELFVGTAQGSPTTTVVSIAVRDGGDLIGVLGLALVPRSVLPQLAPITAAPGREVLVVDKRQRVIASTDPARPPLGAMDDLPRLAGATVASGMVTATLGGVDRLLAYAPVPRSEWALYVIDDPALDLAAERRLLDELTLASAAAAAVAAVVGATLVLLYAYLLRQREALLRSGAALAEASRAKSDFLASMSHELRTPLNAVLGFADLLEEQLGAALDDRRRGYVRNIREAGEHLLRLVNDVLDLSKIEAGRVELRPQVTTLGALLGPVVASARAEASARGLAFDVSAPDEERVRLDPDRVRQVLYNLLSNAVKFTPSGGRVALRARVEDSALVVEVADTGIGIPADKRDRVFGAFERLHEGSSDATGTGLGLAVTKQLVELHGGTIGFKSAEGAGTTFRVRLPDAVVPEMAAERLLVVEDERRDAELIVALAAREGLQCEVVGSAAEAIAAFRRDPPLGVVLDLRLPDERGERVLEALRSDDATRSVPAIVVTVEDDRDGHTRALGADDHLTKPIDRVRLAGWLRAVTARKEDRHAPALGR